MKLNSFLMSFSSDDSLPVTEEEYRLLLANLRPGGGNALVPFEGGTYQGIQLRITKTNEEPNVGHPWKKIVNDDLRAHITELREREGRPIPKREIWWRFTR